MAQTGGGGGGGDVGAGNTGLTGCDGGLGTRKKGKEEENRRCVAYDREGVEAGHSTELNVLKDMRWWVGAGGSAWEARGFGSVVWG